MKHNPMSHVSRSFRSALLVLLLSSAFIGCSPKMSTPSENSATKSPTPISTPSTVSTQPHQLITYRCVKDVSNSGIEPPPGKIVLSFQAVSGGSTSWLNLPKGNLTIIDNKAIDETVSPDGKLLAFIDVDQHAVVVVDVGGRVISTIPDPQELLTPIRWLDDKRLLLTKRQSSPGSREKTLRSLIIYDPFSGQMQEWAANYPDIYPYPYELGWDLMNYFIPNHQLSYIVYPVYDDGGPLVLWDVNKGLEIARINHASCREPEFSPAGDQFVVPISQGPFLVSLGDELVLFGTDGTSTRLTYFTDTTQAEINLYEWSSDGEQIAFMLRLDDQASDKFQLATISVKTHEVTNYCITGNYFFWSVDGKFILLNSGYATLSVYLIRLEDGAMWKLAENADAEGWMIADDGSSLTP